MDIISFFSKLYINICCFQLLSRVWFCNPMDCSMPGFPVPHHLPESAQTHVHWIVMPSNHLIFYCPLLPLPSIFPSVFQGLFQWICTLHQVSFSISSSNEYSGLIPFRIDWYDLLAVQGTLKSLLQHRSSKVSILWHSAFFMVQFSHSYMTTGKAIALIRWTFVGKVMSLLFNMQSRFIIAILPTSKCLLISWLQSPSRVILDPKKIKSITVSIVSPIYLPWRDGTGCLDLSFLNVKF